MWIESDNINGVIRKNMTFEDVINNSFNDDVLQDIIINAFFDSVNYDNILINNGSNCFNNDTNKINVYEVIKTLCTMDLKNLNIDLDYIRYEYYKKIYYKCDLSRFKNCYDYSIGKINIEDVKKIIIDNNLNWDII